MGLFNKSKNENVKSDKLLTTFSDVKVGKVSGIRIGAWYAEQSAGSAKWSVVRLLDFNQMGFYATIYKEDFDTLPTQNDVEKLKPFTLLAPLSIGHLLYLKDFRLISHKPLTEAECLEAAKLELIQMTDVPEDEVQGYASAIYDAQSYTATLLISVYDQISTAQVLDKNLAD